MACSERRVLRASFLQPHARLPTQGACPKHPFEGSALEAPIRRFFRKHRLRCELWGFTRAGRDPVGLVHALGSSRFHKRRIRSHPELMAHDSPNPNGPRFRWLRSARRWLCLSDAAVQWFTSTPSPTRRSAKTYIYVYFKRRQTSLHLEKGPTEPENPSRRLRVG